MNLLYRLSSFLFLMGMAFPLPPNPGLHVALQKAINPNGITLVDKIPEVPGNSSELNIYYPNIPEDPSYYTLDNTTAKSNYEYTSKDTNNITEVSNPIRFGNVAISSEPVKFLAECTVAKNAAGEDNYIFVNYTLNDTLFDAYGDARALFRKRDLDPIPLSDNTSCLFSDHAFSPNQFTTVLVACPPLDLDRSLLYQ